MSVWLLMLAGAVAVAVGWRLVATGRISVWAAMVTASGLAGVAAVATGRVRAVESVEVLGAIGVGAGAGVVLYAATVAFVLWVRRWPLFDRHVEEVYDQRRGLPLGVALFLAAGVVAVGEELFWRGLVQARLGEALEMPWAAAGAGWAAYVAANAASGSLPIMAGAVVAGAVWSALAAWSGGVLASIACHGVWTALMVARPPGGEG